MTSGKPYCTRFADIWALGVILVNMISGRHPWSIATPDDYCFSQWLADPNFLKNMLPISAGANDILLRIFQLEPLKRITLVELRQEITDLDTFFLSPEELDSAGEFAQYVAADLYRTYDRRGRRMRVPVPPPQPIHLPEVRDITSRTASDPTTPIAIRRTFVAQPEVAIPAPEGLFTAAEDECSSGSDQTSSSEASSESVSLIEKVGSAIKVGTEVDIAEARLEEDQQRAVFPVRG